ncbi:MAG: PilZ domain-containing protein (plasmid) [Candidatus Manganitrophus sp.]|nr:PilZ domain-containing protein [Candidatus Manganitrophus sp.]
MADRRKHQRTPITSIVRLAIQGEQTEVRALVRNISTHGIGICSGREIYRQGDIVCVRLALPHGYETLTESISGEVVWVTSLPRRGDYGVGIRFEQMEKEKPRLFHHISSLKR